MAGPKPLIDEWFAICNRLWPLLFLREPTVKQRLSIVEHQGRVKAVGCKLARELEARGIDSTPLLALVGNLDGASDPQWDDAWVVVRRLEAIMMAKGEASTAKSGDSGAGGDGAGTGDTGDTKGDTPESPATARVPRSPDVRDAIFIAKRAVQEGRKILPALREFTSETTGDDRRARNLQRQIRRYRPLWDKQD